MDVKEIGDKLVALCRENKHLEAIDSLYSDKIVSVESQGDENMPARMEGIEAIRGKNKWWLENHEVHSAVAEGPMVNGDSFAVIFDYDVTMKTTGQRHKMKEVALYTVDAGKIAREEFFY